LTDLIVLAHTFHAYDLLNSLFLPF